MITIRKAAERGHFDHGWLDTWHSFSFADYHDPDFEGFRSLRVINEDFVAPGQGFPTHFHRDMEIVTCVLEGTIEHKDSMGNAGRIRPGEVQRMTAGRGVTHSEFNPSRTDRLHLLQIWILPGRKGLEPGYEQKTFPEAERRGRLRLIASPDGRDGSVTIRQDARIYAGLLAPGGRVSQLLAPGRHAWLQVARGALTLNGRTLAAGDGAAAEDETDLELSASEDAEVLLFDLA